jgi:hypothetical protein
MADAENGAPNGAPAAKMHFWDDSWDLRASECPCDVEFIEWLDENRITDAAIYHFGSGAHHHVGIECANVHRRNSVIAITAAPQEHQKYVELAIERPDVLRYYNCVFGDIYLVNERLLPIFDVVTLFHLCEFRGEKTDAYQGLTDLEVANILTDKVCSSGYILFFTGSFAFDWQGPTSTKKVIEEWEKRGDVKKQADFKTLRVYRKT